MPAMPRARVCRSLSPSLLSTTPHRYFPYYRTSSSSSFAESTSSTSASETGSTSSQDSCGCDGLRSLNLVERSVNPEQNPRLPPIAPTLAPHLPITSGHARSHAHRRAISLSSTPSGYMTLPLPRSRPTPPVHASMPARPIPSIRRSHSNPHPHYQRQIRQHRLSPIRIPSPPLTPIQGSPRPRTDMEQLMWVTPSVAAYLRQGGSVSVKGRDGKNYKIRAPVRPPISSVRMMRML